MPECLNPARLYAGGSAIAGALPRRNPVITRGTQLRTYIRTYVPRRWVYDLRAHRDVCSLVLLALSVPPRARRRLVVVVVAHDSGAVRYVRTYPRRFPFAFIHGGGERPTDVAVCATFSTLGVTAVCGERLFVRGGCRRIPDADTTIYINRFRNERRDTKGMEGNVARKKSPCS